MGGVFPGGGGEINIKLTISETSSTACSSFISTEQPLHLPEVENPELFHHPERKAAPIKLSLPFPSP